EWIDRDALARGKEPGDADRAAADLDDAGLPGREGVESESLQPAHQLFRAPAVPVHLGHGAGRDARRDRAPVFTFIALGALPTVGAYHVTSYSMYRRCQVEKHRSASSIRSWFCRPERCWRKTS